MKKIKMSCLSIELTRRCNLKCSHCFKGDAQNIDISAHHIEKMLGMIDEIYTVHITGGEPSLNLDGMRMLIDCIKKNQIAVHRLNVICNGIADTTERFFTMLDELNKIVLQPKDTRITISCDPYHSATGKISVLYLFEGWDAVKKLNKKEYSFKVLPYFTCCYPPIVSMGNGASNQSFANPDNPDEYGVLYNHPVNIYDNVIKHISIHANGIIGRDLNISYHDADNKKYQICHIDDISTPEDLIESVRLWNERTDVKIRGILFDIASRMPSRYKVNEEQNKVAFRTAAANVLPEKIAFRKKLGFIVPIRIWMADERYNQDVQRLFGSEIAEKFFNVDEINAIFDDYVGGNSDNWRKVWTIYTFLVWYEIYFG